MANNMIAKVAIAVPNNAPSKDIVEYLTKELRKSANISVVEPIAVCYTKEQVDKVVREGNCDVVICVEELGDGPVGKGSITEWFQNESKLRVVMICNNSRKGGPKLKSFYEIGYYNAIYNNDAVYSNIEQLILNDRNIDDAIRYYGIEEYVKSKKLEQEQKLAEQMRLEKEQQDAAAAMRIPPMPMPTPMVNETAYSNEKSDNYVRADYNPFSSGESAHIDVNNGNNRFDGSFDNRYESECVDYNSNMNGAPQRPIMNMSEPVVNSANPYTQPLPPQQPTYALTKRSQMVAYEVRVSTVINPGVCILESKENLFMPSTLSGKEVILLVKE